MKKIMTVRFEKKIIEKLTEYAENRDLNRSALVRLAVNDLMRRRSNDFEVG